MSKFFTVDVLPAQRGDALWIEYGSEGGTRRILIDGGIMRTGREHVLKKVQALEANSQIDLLIVTHIDLDHILGVIELLKALPRHVTIDRVWFNGWDQLPRDDLIPQGVPDGIKLSELLAQHHSAAWNVDSKGAAIMVADDGRLPEYPLPDGMTVTVLSPDRAKLQLLKDKWKDAVEPFGAQPEDDDAVDEDEDPGREGLEAMGAEDIDVETLAGSAFEEDTTPPNGSSIAVMLEFAGKRVLMLADAHPTRILRSLDRLSPMGALSVDCVKVSHHGSKNNSSRALIRKLRSPRWIFSSNGATTRHPNPEAVGRVLADSPGTKTLYFNYKTKLNDMWDSRDLKADHDYVAIYGDGLSSVPIDLME